MVMGEETRETDLLVIGGGAGGYAAAFRAADHGLDVVLVTDEEELGGVCLHRGCIPGKVLLQMTQLLSEVEEAKDWGIDFGKPDIDLDKFRNWKNNVVDRLITGLDTLSEHRDVTVIQGRAEFESSNKVRLHNADLAHVEFKQCIVATGSHPIRLLDTEFKPGGRIMDGAMALDLPDVPEKLLIVGGGYIGLEMGMVYAALGSKITIVEMTDGLLPGVDRDIVEPAAKRIESIAEAVYVNTTVSHIEQTDSKVTVKLEGDANKELQFDRVLVAIGRQPNTNKLGLENTQVELNKKGFVIVDQEQRTTDEMIFAVGDITGEPLLAHKAMHEGEVAAHVIAGEPAAFDVRAIPKVVYTEPQVAWCGLLPDAAKESGYNVGVGRFPWRASGRALTEDTPEGLTKLVFDKDSNRLLGAGIVGKGASELISEAALAIEMGAVARDLSLTNHPHPTLSETLSEAAQDYMSQPIHSLS